MFKEAKTPRGLTVFGKEKDQKSDSDSCTEMTWDDSPWPARNSQVFSGLNSFMERCNDVLELVETTRHFRMMRSAAEVGGAGGQGLDAMVREIHETFEKAMIEFKGGVQVSCSGLFFLIPNSLTFVTTSNMIFAGRNLERPVILLL